MSKLILVTNPITNEQIEYKGDHPTLFSLMQGFVIANPDYVNYLFGKDASFSIHINGNKIENPKFLVKIFSDTDEVLLVPEIGVPILPFILMAMSAISSAASGVMGAGIAIGATSSVVGGATLAGGSIVVGSASTLAAATAFGGTVITVGGIVQAAALAGSLIGVASAFSSHKPSMSGGSDDPGRSSPTYGWSVQSTSDEGIPIAIPYGKMKIGGNLISTVCESKASFIYDWYEPSDNGCSLIALPIIPNILLPIPYVNVALAGLWPPVRGFYCKLDPSSWFYIFISFKIYSFGGLYDAKEFLEGLARGGLIRSREDLDVFFDAVKAGVSGFFKRKFDSIFCANLTTKIDSWRAAGIGPFKNDIIDLIGITDNNISFNKADFGNATLPNHTTIIEEVYKWLASMNKDRRLSIEVIIPALTGNEYGLMFDYDPETDRNLGCYAVAAICGNPYSTVPGWYISDFMGLTVNKDFINFEEFTLAGPTIGLSEEQYLNQLIALGEGECTGVEQVFVNDNPITSFPAIKYFFVPGKNDQVVAGITANDEMDYYANTATSYSVNAELEEPMDYAIHTCNTPVNNVYIRCSFNANRMTLKGKLTDLGERPIHFAILVGFDDTADFSTFVPDTNGLFDSISPLLSQWGIEGKYIPYIYKEYGGSRETIYKTYRAFPIVDYINGNMEGFVKDFPGAIQVMCALFSITEVEGEPINWDKFNRVLAGWPGVPYSWDDCTVYRDKIFELVREKIQEFFINVSRRLVVKIMRLSPHVDNNRYSDKMSVLGFDQIMYAGFNYPNTALLGVKVRATEQLAGSAPKISLILRGKKILVPKLVLLGNNLEQVYHEFAWYDEDVGRYRSMHHSGQLCMYAKDSKGNYIWVSEYCNNPIWCLYDLLTSTRYGLGSFIENSDHDIPQYILMAEHCDELVPDGTQRFASEFTVNTMSDTDVDYFSKGQMYYDSNSGNWLRDYTISSKDQSRYGYTMNIFGTAVFARNSSGGWTKAVIGNMERFEDVLTQLFSYIRVTFLRCYSNGAAFWTNSAPLNTGGREYQLSEKRYQLNLCIDDQSSAIDIIKMICDTFRCSPVWIGGMVRPVIDRLESAKAVIGMGNIIKDSLAISYTPISDVPNVISAQFQNSENYYEKDTRQIIDPDIDESFAPDIIKSVRKKDIKLLGISNPSQIQRELNYRLLTGKYRTSIINFKTGIENLNMVAGDVFVFTHDLFSNSGLSGRVLDRSGSNLILDQDIRSIEGDLVIQIKNIDSLGVEFVSEYNITGYSEDGRTVIVSGLPAVDADFSFKFRPYIIGTVSQISEKYRALTVLPDTNGEVEVNAIVYKEEVFGEQRALNSGSGYTAYSDGTVAYQENRLSLVPVTFLSLPVTDVKAYAQFNSTPGKADVVVTFKPPVALKYYGAFVQWKDQETGAYTSQDTVYVQRQMKNEVYINDLSIGNTYLIAVTAQYRDSADSAYHLSFPVEISLKIDTAIIIDTDTPDDPANPVLTPNPPKNLRLSVLSISPLDPNWLHPVMAQNYCFHSHFIIDWDRGGFEEAANFWEQKGNWIDHYQMSITTEYDNGSLNTPKIINLPFWSSSYVVTLEDMGITRFGDRTLVNNVTVQLVSISNHGRMSDPIRCWRTFYPIDETAPGLSPPGNVYTYPVYFGVIVEWIAMSDWVDVDHFEVELKGWKAGHTPSGTGDEDSDYWWHSLLNENVHVKKCSLPFTYFHIPYAEKLDALQTGPFGVMAGVTWKAKVKVVNKQGATAYSYSLPGDMNDANYINDSGGGGAVGSGGEIPDWALSSTTTNTAVFDNVGLFAVSPTVDWMRTALLNYTIDYDERQELVDSIITDKNGITYNCGVLGLLVNVARIAYHSPGEERYKGLYVYTNSPAKVWIEYLCPVAGDYSLGSWKYLGGNSAHNLVSGKMVDLGSFIPFITVGQYINVPAGGTQLNFPFTVVTRFIRLVIQPSSGLTITVREIRFNRTGEFDSLTVGELSAISANLGTITAGSLWFNLTQTYDIIDPNLGALVIGDGGLAGYNKNAQRTFYFQTSEGKAFFKGWDGTAAAVIDTSGNTDSLADGVITVTGSGKGIVVGEGAESIIIGREVGGDGITNYIRLGAGSSFIDVMNGGFINIQTDGYINVLGIDGIRISGGSISVTSGGTINVHALSYIKIEADGYMELDAGGFLRLTADSYLQVDSGGSLRLIAGGSLIGTGAIITLSADSVMTFSGATIRMHTSGTFVIGLDYNNPAFTFNIYNEDLKIGKSGINSIIIDGKNGYIYSANYLSGVLGQGFQIRSDGSIEASDMDLRGSLRSSSFVYEEVATIGGKFMVTKTATLSRDLEDTSDTTLFLDDDPGFEPNEFLWIKQGLIQERMRVGSVYPWYSDMSFSQKSVTNYFVTRNTNIKYYGDYSGYFTGLSSRMSVPVSDDFNFGSGAFCLESFVYIVSGEMFGDIISQKGIFTGTNFLRDYSSGEHIVTPYRIPPIPDYTDKKFGISSCNLRNPSSYSYFTFEQIGGNEISRLFSSGENYTIEFFTKPTGNNQGPLIVSRQNPNSPGSPFYGFRTHYISNKMYHVVANGNTYEQVSGEMLMTADWTHVAVQRRGTSLEMYINGALKSSAKSTLNPSFSGEKIWVGQYPGSNFYGGHIDEMRISGIARYSGETLTVPVSEFVNDANTKVLFHFNDDHEEIIRLGISGERGFYFNAKSATTGLDVQLKHNRWESGETWHHVAATRESDAVRLFVNGTIVDSVSTELSMPTLTYPVNVGGYDISGNLNAYLDELRISKGQARYTANFDIPDEPTDIDEYHVLYLPFDTSGGVYSVQRGYTSTETKVEQQTIMDNCQNLSTWESIIYNTTYGYVRIVDNEIVRVCGAAAHRRWGSRNMVGSIWRMRFRTSSTPNSTASTYRYDGAVTNCYSAINIMKDRDRGVCFTIGHDNAGTLTMYYMNNTGAGPLYTNLFPYISVNTVYELEVSLLSEYTGYALGYNATIRLYDSVGTLLYTVTNVPCSFELTSWEEDGFTFRDFCSTSTTSYVDIDWVSVTSTETVTYTYGNGEKHAWTKGTSVISLRTNVDDGFMLLDSESTFSPFMDIYRRTSSVHFDNYECKVRLGNLDGMADILNGTWHETNPGFGLYCDNVYLKGKLYLGEGKDIKLVSTTGDSAKISWIDSYGGELVSLNSYITGAGQYIHVTLSPTGLATSDLHLGLGGGTAYRSIFLNSTVDIDLSASRVVCTCTTFQVNGYIGYTGTFKDYYGNNVYYRNGLCIGVL